MVEVFVVPLNLEVFDTLRNMYLSSARLRLEKVVLNSLSFRNSNISAISSVVDVFDMLMLEALPINGGGTNSTKSYGGQINNWGNVSLSTVSLEMSKSMLTNAGKDKFSKSIVAFGGGGGVGGTHSAMHE